MQNKSTSSSKKTPPPKSSTLTPKASSSSQSINTFKNKKEDVRPDDSQTLQKKINELLQLKFSVTIEEKIVGEKIKKMFDPLKPTDLKKCFQQCARLALDIKPKQSKEWKEKNMKIIVEASQLLEKSKQYLKLTNKKKQQSQILPQEQDQEQKGQYNNLMMKKRKQDIIEDYKRIRKHNTLLQRIIQGQILTNFTKLYKIIPLQRRIINQQNEEHYDPQGIKDLESICKADDLEPIQISKIEQLLAKEKRMSADIKRYLQSIAEVDQKIKNLEKNMKKALKNNELEQSYDQIIKLWILIQNSLNIINVSIFLRLIKLNKQSNNQIQGKNIALLIGPSGAGKTTIMLRMLGYQMCLTSDNLTGLKTLMPKKKINPQHNGLISRPGAQSVTQTIFAAELKKIYLTQLQNLLICDTPGFFDSSGPVVDLVNGISLINAIKKAKSVKPIIVISANMVGQRLEGVKKLGKIVSNLLTKLDKNEEGLAITFIFNKFANHQQFLRLEPGVKNILQNLSQTDKINTKYVRFLQLLHQTLFKKMKDKYILFKPYEFDIESTLKILQQNLIQNPGQVFQYSHSTQSIQVLQLFMKKKMQLINFYLDYNPKHSYFHLQQLKLLIDHLKIGQYENEYKLIKKNIEEKSLQYFTSFKYLLSEETWKDNITDGQIIESKNMYDKLMSLQIFREQKQCDLYSHKDFDLVIDSLKTTFEKIKNKIDKLQELSADQRNITKKMQIFCKQYNLQAFSYDLKNSIMKRYNNITNQLEKLLKANNFEGYKQFFQQYKQVQKLIKLFNNEDGKIQTTNFNVLLETKYQKISDIFKASLTLINQKLLVQQLSIFPEQINNNLILLQQIQQISEQLFSTGKKQRQQSIKTIKNTILKLQSDFKVFLKSKNPQNRKKMYAILANLEVIKTFQKLSKFVQAIITNIKETIETLIDDYKTKFTQIFQKLENGQICSSFSHVYTYIYALANYPKLLNTDSKQKEVQRFIQQIQQDFMKNIKKIIQKTRAINITLKSLLKNDNLSLICNRLNQLKYAQNAFSSKIQTHEYFEDLKDQIEKFITLCKQKREAPLNQLKKVIQHAQQQSDISSTIQKVCEDIKRYNQYAQELGELFTTKIKSQIIESVQKQKKQYFLKVHREYNEEHNKIKDRYIWDLSGDQEVSYRKRVSNLINLQESVREDSQVQRLYSYILQQHISMLSKSIEYYSKDQKLSGSKNKLQIGSELKKYEQYLDEQDRIQLNTLIRRYQNNQYEANEIELASIFQEKFLNYEKLSAFYDKNKDSSKIATDIQSKMEVYDRRVYQLLIKIIDNPPQIKEIDNHQYQLTLLEHANQLIKRQGYFNSIFIEEGIFQTDRKLIQKVLQPFKNQFKNIFQIINLNILKIDFSYEQTRKKIDILEKLQKMIQLIFDREYADWQQNFFINPLVQNLKNIPVFKLFPCYKYLQQLLTQIKSRRSKDITDLIDPKCSQSIKFYPSLNSLHKQQYLRPLLLQFQSIKQELLEKHRGYDSRNRQKQLIDLFPTKQLQEKYQEQFDKIHDQSRHQVGELSRRITISLQEKQFSCVFDAFKDKKQFVCSDHVAAVAKKIEQQYQQAQLNNSDIGSLEQQFVQLENSQQNLAGDMFLPIFSAIYNGKNKIVQNLLIKIDRILEFIRWESPLKIPSLKERKQLQNRLIQLVKANRIINRYKQFVSENTLRIHKGKIIEAFERLIHQYQSFSPKQIDNLGKYQLMDLIRSKIFTKNIIVNIKSFMKNTKISDIQIKNLLLLQLQNDWLSKFVQNINQQQIKNDQFYQKTITQFQKTNNQNTLRENFQAIKHSFQFLIDMEEIQQKLLDQVELNFTDVIIQRSCIKQLKNLCDNLFKQANLQLNNCKSIRNDHNLHKIIIFSQFLSLWQNQQHTKFAFAKQSSIQLKDKVTTKLEQLIEQTLVYIKGKQNVNSKQEQGNIAQVKSRVSPTSPAQIILNTLILFQQLKQKLIKHQGLINKKMNQILQQLPSLPNNMKIALNQELMRRQDQPYISILCTNYRQFKHIKQVQFSQKTKVKVQQYLQKFLKENKENNQFYKKSSNSVFDQYQASIQLHGQNTCRETKQALIASIRSDVSKIPVQRIIGKLFGLYSIIKKQYSCAVKYFQPHVSQVIAILTLLKLKENDSVTLENNLVQIPTGQGKSIVLGICACYLALRGFQVYHSCYSPILIHRDRMEFRELYKQLKIDNKVFYGSFQETCEKILPDKFNELAIQLIQKSRLSLFYFWASTKLIQKYQSFKDLFKAKLQQLSSAKKILLLDEVDVLLSPDYYNRLYTPTLDITDNFLESREMTRNGQDLITKLFLQIYEKNKKQKNFHIQSIDQFEITQKIVEVFPQIKEILFHIMREIIFSAKNKSKIKQITAILSFKDRFKSQKCNSYLQLMAGVQMFRNGNLSYDQLKRSLKIKIKLCELSYSELPKYFSSIIGATGTLKSLTQRKKRILINQYEMLALYHLPTIYKQKKFSQQRCCFQQSKTRYLQVLTQNICNHLDKKGQRAVLVLFESQQSLKQFKKSLSFKKLGQRYTTNFLIFNTDKFNYDEVSKMIVKTTLANTVTLATKQFGRGIDFKDEVGLQQGLFVIIAYLPDCQQEYIQAKGRTARAGKNGKVLLCAHQEQNVDSQDVEKTLKTLFIRQQQQKINEIKNSIEPVKLKHKETLEVYTNDKSSVIGYLEKINKFDCRTIRIILGIEIALRNRSQMLKQFVDQIKTYEAAYQQRSFQIQIKVFAYGNYIDLNRQMQSIGSYQDLNRQQQTLKQQKYGRIQSKSEQLTIDDVLQFNTKIIEIRQNKTSAKGESVELFFKYMKDLSKQAKNIDHVYLFCSKQNLSWSRFIQTVQYRRLQENKVFLENYKQKQPCIDYIKRFEDKTSLNIFCFNTVDRDVRIFYEDLNKQTKCINQLQFVSEEQFKKNADLYCTRTIGQTLKNVPNKK